MSDIAKQVLEEYQLESNAQKAKDYLNQLNDLMGKMIALQPEGQKQEPVSYCRNLILSYGLKQLESKIIRLTSNIIKS
jgi:hypothetical protein